LSPHCGQISPSAGAPGFTINANTFGDHYEGHIEQTDYLSEAVKNKEVNHGVRFPCGALLAGACLGTRQSELRKSRWPGQPRSGWRSHLWRSRDARRRRLAVMTPPTQMRRRKRRLTVATEYFASVACPDLATSATYLLIASGKLHPVSEVLAA
jgi:hypothetical protein